MEQWFLILFLKELPAREDGENKSLSLKFLEGRMDYLR
jgi:hypothetical protein